MHIRYSHLLAATLALSGCTTTTQNTGPEAISKPSMVVNIPMTPVSIGCLSHDGAPPITSFYVQEPFSKQMLGGLSCGGSGAFGYMLPLTWQPGMKVKVRWKPNARDWIEKNTTIRRYNEAGDIFVHFFANDEVRIVSAARYGAQNPNHPILKSLTIAPPEEE
ncbi:DUF3304 domain-containing protein [Collimonas antrihumi]|uniref:DUF3304 domain-containing protein n=1 Tax=Collimonas antrihumi TaxID=1940615 RepID=UPI001B8BBDB0|nr:DUF3304 domain-containing protein [Collimonas antrihumi]